MRFGDEAVWAPDCSCPCGGKRGEYVYPRGFREMGEVLSRTYYGEWPAPGVLKGRDIFMDGWRLYLVEDPGNRLRNGMRVEVELAARPEKDRRVVVVTERFSSGEWLARR